MTAQLSTLAGEIADELERRQVELEDAADALAKLSARANGADLFPPGSPERFALAAAADYVERVRKAHVLPAAAGLRSYVASLRAGLDRP